MISKKLNSTTAIVVALSFLQPLPGFAQAKAQTPAPIPAEALETTLLCLADFKGKPKDAEEACLEELKLAEVACDPGLLLPEGTPAAKDKGGSNEQIAERIVRAVNAEVCMSDQAKAATAEAQVAAEDKAQADAEALAAADAKAAADLKAQEADADAKAQADADARAAADAKAATDLKAQDAAKAEADAKAKAESAALAAALAEADAAAKAADADAKSKAKSEKADAKAESKAAKVEADATAKAEEAAALAEKKAASEAEAQADADAKALLEAEARSQAETTAIADAEAAAQAKKAEETAIAEEKARAEAAAAAADECVVELVDAAGETLCADDMSQAEIAAVTAAAEANTDVEVTTQTVTEEATRSSTEEFAETKAGSDDGGLSNLEKAGLLVLGAVVVGAILKNGEKVTAKTGDRVVVQDQYGNYSVLKDDDVLVRQAGDTVRTETFSDGSTRTFVTRPDGVQIVTIRDSLGQVLRRTRIDTDGNEVLLIDDTRRFEPVEVSKLPTPYVSDLAYRDATDRAALREALRAAESREIGRTFSLSQVREYREVRNLAPEINLDNITFETNSAAIQPTEAEQLREIGLLMQDLIAENPREVFLVEGYTDAVGDESYNLLLSDRRAETVALALSEYFGVRSENMVVQGYGERFPLVPTLESERLNRRVAVRRITNLIQPR